MGSVGSQQRNVFLVNTVHQTCLLMALAALPLYGSVWLVCLPTWDDLGLDFYWGPFGTQLNSANLRSTIPASLVASLQVGLQMSPPHTSLGAMGAARRWLIFFGDGCSCCSWRSHVNVRWISSLLHLHLRYQTLMIFSVLSVLVSATTSTGHRFAAFNCCSHFFTHCSLCWRPGETSPCWRCPCSCMHLIERHGRGSWSNPTDCGKRHSPVSPWKAHARPMQGPCKAYYCKFASGCLCNMLELLVQDFVCTSCQANLLNMRTGSNRCAVRVVQEGCFFSGYDMSSQQRVPVSKLVHLRHQPHSVDFVGSCTSRLAWRSLCSTQSQHGLHPDLRESWDFDWLDLGSWGRGVYMRKFRKVSGAEVQHQWLNVWLVQIETCWINLILLDIGTACAEELWTESSWLKCRSCCISLFGSAYRPSQRSLCSGVSQHSLLFKGTFCAVRRTNSWL